MKAGIVAIKVPIGAIKSEETTEDVTELKKSIARWGLLQPVGVAKRKGGYTLVFGRRRLRACRELGYTFIHAVLLTVSPEDEKTVRLNENLERKYLNVPRLSGEILALPGSAEVDDLPLSREQTRALVSFWSLSPEARRMVDERSEPFLISAEGKGDYFLRICHALEDVPNVAKEKLRISLLSDKRIFLNEIERIVNMMKRGGYQAAVTEEEDRIIIHKNAG